MFAFWKTSLLPPPLLLMTLILRSLIFSLLALTARMVTLLLPHVLQNQSPLLMILDRLLMHLWRVRSTVTVFRLPHVLLVPIRPMLLIHHFSTLIPVHI